MFPDPSRCAIFQNLAPLPWPMYKELQDGFTMNEVIYVSLISSSNADWVKVWPLCFRGAEVLYANVGESMCLSLQMIENLQGVGMRAT